jgi:hypothetical protein
MSAACQSTAPQCFVMNVLWLEHHILNNPHCMDVQCQGENVFRKPFGHETLTFKLEIDFCQICRCDNPLGNHKWYSVGT